MKTIIIILPVEENDREKAELINGCIYSSEKTMFDSFRLNKVMGAIWFELEDFVTGCNDQEVLLDLYWVAYVYFTE